MCGCNKAIKCNTCQPKSCTPQQPCDCPAGYFSSDCINNVKTEFTCFDIESGQTLTDTLSQMEQETCEAIEEIRNYGGLVNVGLGSEIYAGVNNLGKKKIRKLNSGESDLITVTQNTDDISITIDEENLETFVENLIPPQNTFSVTSEDNSVTITESDGVFDLSVETTAPTDVNITGSGATTVTEPTPNNFVVSSTNTIVMLQDGITTDIIGDGVTIPYSVEVLNLQKKITADYTLQSTDNHYTIVVDTSSGDVDITVPTGLVANISINFTQIGTGIVAFITSGTTINSPIGLKIKGENYWANIYKRADISETFQLAGALKL